MKNYSDFNAISISRLNINLEDYKEKFNTEITLLKVNFKKKKIIFCDGIPKDAEVFENHFRKTGGFSNDSLKGGYVCRNSSEHDLKLTSDIFFFDSKLRSGSQLLEIIVIHEICHLLEQSNYYKEIKLDLNKEDEVLGLKIEEIAFDVADKLGFHDPYHNKTFGSLMSYFFGKYNLEKKAKLLSLSLQPNFFYDYSSTFKKIIKEINNVK